MGLVAVVAAAALASAAPPGVVQTCNDAPPGSALAGVGRFAHAPARVDRITVLDVSENACAPASPRPRLIGGGVHSSVTDGLQLRVVPGPEGASVAGGTTARGSLIAGPGQAILSYSAVFSGRRADAGFALRLTALTNDGRRVVLGGCEAQKRCDGPGGEESWVAPGTRPGIDGPFARQEFGLPPETVRLEWSLACEARSCSTAATGDPATRGLTASLNVYGSTAVLDPPR